MVHLIDKAALVAEIERLIKEHSGKYERDEAALVLDGLEDFIDTLEVKDPYEQYVQYDSIKAGIQAHAETYSFNIESLLFNQLTKEQQALWRKEIEQAVISGGEMGVELAKDMRYKENLEVKEVDLDSDIRTYLTNHFNIYEDGVLQSKKSELPLSTYDIIKVARHFFELGLQVSNKAQ